MASHLTSSLGHPTQILEGNIGEKFAFVKSFRNFPFLTVEGGYLVIYSELGAI